MAPGGPLVSLVLERDAEFDEVVDAEGAIDIRGRSFARSEVLASDPVAYREALVDYRQEKQVELLETVTEGFPYPVAHCLYRFLNSARSENERLQFLKDSWESIIAVAFALAAAEIRAGGETIAVTTDKVRDFKRYLDSQNIRDRLEVVRVCCNSLAELRVLRSVFAPETIEQLIGLNGRRNVDFAHLGTLSERRSSELVAELEPEMMSLLGLLEPLRNLEVVRYEGPGKRGEGRFETFVGHASTRTIVARSLSGDAAAAIGGRSKEEVLLLHEGRVIPLSPMIVMRDGRGHRSELAFMKKRRVENQRNIFTFESFGVAEEFELDSPDLASDLEAVKMCFTQGGGAT